VKDIFHNSDITTAFFPEIRERWRGQLVTATETRIQTSEPISLSKGNSRDTNVSKRKGKNFSFILSLFLLSLSISMKINHAF
jgi:hypothetical protein